MNLEQIIQHILMARRDLSREDVLKKIYEKKRSAEDYFLDEVAARIVATELGVEISTEETPLREVISIKDLVSGLNDVTFIGRVIAVYPVQTFARSDLTEGKVARLVLADKTGTLRLVLWNDKIGLVEDRKIRSGQIIKVSHGYVREGLDGKLELHVGQRGEVQIAPPDAGETDYPQVADFIDKIGNLTSESKRASVMGLVHDVYPASEFKRQEGTVGKVRRLRLKDETGETTVVFWNEKVDYLGDVEKGGYLRIMDARVKEPLSGGLELHVEGTTQIEKLAEHEISLPVHPSGLIKIGDLKSSMRDVNVMARVTRIEAVREFKRPSGDTGKVATVHLMDATGTVQLSLWNEKAEAAIQINVGDVVLIEHAYTRQRLGKTEINLGEKGNLTINPATSESVGLPPLPSLPPVRESPVKKEKCNIADIRNEGGPFTIEAMVATTPTIREVVTSRNEKVLVASFDISDETGKIRISLWRQLAETARDLAIGARIKVSNIYARKGFSNLLELVSRTQTTVEIASKPGS